MKIAALNEAYCDWLGRMRGVGCGVRVVWVGAGADGHHFVQYLKKKSITSARM